jgi:putative ABC transport system permease protein
MYFIELTQQILREMRVRKLRSILALFGIVWGTVAVILLLSLGHGFYLASKKNMSHLVDGMLIFNHSVTSLPFRGMPPGQSIHIKASDVLGLKELFHNIRAVSPDLSNLATIQHKDTLLSDSEVDGVDSNYGLINNYQVAKGGRFIDSFDVANSRQVVFIGNDLKQSLFGKDKAVGHQIFVNNVPFTIIGVMQTRPDAGKWYNNITIIPYTTALELWGDQDVDSFAILPKNENHTAELKKGIINYFANRYAFNPNDKSAMSVFDFTMISQFFSWFFLSIEVFLGFCGAMTLGVGGLGVANIMFLIVTERTHEIGLRMAMGARRSHIMLQILLEASIIVLIGGLLGFVISLTSILILAHLSLPDWLGSPTISPAVTLITLFILTLTALLAGYFPARRAANMQPVTALAF